MDIETPMILLNAQDAVEMERKFPHENPQILMQLQYEHIIAEIQTLRRDMMPIADFFAMIPEAIESNPMMSMMFGKALKRK
jgi:hypothetical protein